MVHDGHSNTPFLKNDSVHHKFLKGMKHEHMCFALIPRDDKEDTNEILVELSNFLNNFQDIFSYIVYLKVFLQ